MSIYIGTIPTQYQTLRVTVEVNCVLINSIGRVGGQQKYVLIKKGDLERFIHTLWVLIDHHEQSIVLGEKAEPAGSNTFNMQLVVGGEAELFLRFDGTEGKLKFHVSKARTLLNILLRAARQMEVDIAEAQAAHDKREAGLWEKIEGVNRSGMVDIDLWDL